MEDRAGRRLTLGPVDNLLLACGFLAAILAIAVDLLAGSMRAGYSFTSQSASVLTAPGAPTRGLVVGVNLLANLLVVAFAIGVWMSAHQKRSLRVMAVVLVIAAALQVVAAMFFPFHPGEPTDTSANRLNVALMAPSIVGWFLAIVLGAVAERNWYRYFSIAVLLALLAEDVLVTAGASLFVPGGHPGSLVGVQERANGYGFFVWLALLGWVRLRSGRPRSQTRSHRSGRRLAGVDSTSATSAAAKG